jgi:GxxExxY protein
MKHELELRGIQHFSKLTIPITYKGLELETGLRFDLLIDNKVIVELKSVESVLPIHEAQLLTYMKLTEC